MESMAHRMALDPNTKTKLIEVVSGIQITKVEDIDDIYQKAAFKPNIGKDILQKHELKNSDYSQNFYPIHEISKLIKSTIVEHCTRKSYWPDWAGDVGKIAHNTTERIQALIQKKENQKITKLFKSFVTELQDDLNESISEKDAIEMLAQHLVTKPIFDAMFEKKGFAQKNPVSKSMDKILKAISFYNPDSETQKLDEFYESVKERAKGINSPEAKQELIKELYDKFFRKAFPLTTEKLGIAYTPIEIADFILRSVEDVLKKDFQSSLSHKNVHILDPFTGTGTFITRLMQLGLIKPKALKYKYTEELHANELVLLAYYVAAVNIETTYSEVSKDEYLPFPGICLTDTFAMDREDEMSKHLPTNSQRRTRQQKTPIRVIVGNPPYSAGQKNENDNAKNVEYPKIDASIKDSYAVRSKATLQRSLYDSYIRAIRWASDRISSSHNGTGIVAFVTNAYWIRSLSADGMRKTVGEEFSSIYVLDLRGNFRISGKDAKKEGGSVFGNVTQAPIAITLFVKAHQAKTRTKNEKQKQTQIYYHDIGDYLSTEQKLKAVETFQSTAGVPWKIIKPDVHGDWLNQRDESFYDFIKIADKKSEALTLYSGYYSLGVATSRDAWVIDLSKKKLAKNVKSMIRVYEDELERWQASDKSQKISDFITQDGTKIKWTENLKNHFKKEKSISRFQSKDMIICHYRPFAKNYLYFSRELNERIYQIPQIFPLGSKDKNLVIAVTGKGCRHGFSAFMMDCVPSYDTINKGQCFPLYWYPKGSDGKRVPAISAQALKQIQRKYPRKKISHKDVFYYIYGLFHVPKYAERYASNLKKELPRIPFVNSYKDFCKFVEAGKKLGDIHVNFEKQSVYKGVKIEDRKRKELSGYSELQKKKHYGLKKMKFASTKNQDRENAADKSTIIYNENIAITNIPLEAYNYRVNGKSAIEWVMDRQSIRTDKESGIVKDPNDYAVETMDDPRYPLKLICRIVTVSLKTQEIVKALPKVNFDTITKLSPKKNQRIKKSSITIEQYSTKKRA